MEPVAVLDAISSPRRREILRLVWDQEQTAGAIHRAMPDVTFGAVSLQLRLLADAGLIVGEKRGRWTWWRVAPERLAALREALGGA